MENRINKNGRPRNKNWQMEKQFMHLKFTDERTKQVHYFVALGATHFSETYQKAIHLISVTTPDIEKARVFATEEDANTELARTGPCPGWEVVA